MKKVIITGASGNLGTACVKKFLDEGYYVIAVGSGNSVNNPGAAPAKDNIEFVRVDLSSEMETAAFIKKTIETHKKIDAALMLVGGFAAGGITTTAGEDIHKMFSLNFETAYFVTRPLLEHMQQNKSGRLIFVGARPALIPAQGKDLLAYSLTKSLLFKLAEFINEDNKGSNVTATVVVPSTIDTPLNRKVMADADPNNWVSPEALAETMEFVVSEKGNSLREAVLKVYNNA